VLAEAAGAAVFAPAPHSLVLADAATAAVFALALHPLVLADVAAAVFFARAPLYLMLADAAAAAVSAPASPMLVFTYVCARSLLEYIFQPLNLISFIRQLHGFAPPSPTTPPSSLLLYQIRARTQHTG